MKSNHHSVQVLQPNSSYIGRRCPSARAVLKSGDQVIVCHKNDEAFSWAALPALVGKCPYCGKQIDLRKIITSPDQVHLSKPAKSGESQRGQPKPDYVPAQRGVLSLPMIALIAVLGLWVMGICGAGAVMGYLQTFAQATKVPEVAIPTVITPSSIVGATRSMNTPIPTTLDQQTPVASVATQLPTVEEQVVNVIRKFNADQQGVRQQIQSVNYLNVPPYI